MTTVKRKLVIPDGLDFSALELRHNPVKQMVDFKWAPIKAICVASGIDVAMFDAHHKENVPRLIHSWYRRHLGHGGAPDPVMQMSEEADGAHAQVDDPFGQHSTN